MKKTILNKLKGFLILVICVVLLTFTALNVLSGPSKPGLFSFYGYTVVSDSMKPKFKAGDYIVVHQDSFNDLSEGEIVTYLLDNETFVTHRLIREQSGEWLVQGDQNDHVDESLVTPVNYVGTYVFSIPYLGGWLMYLKHPLVTATLCLLIVVYLLYLFWRSGRQVKEEN